VPKAATWLYHNRFADTPFDLYMGGILLDPEARIALIDMAVKLAKNNGNFDIFEKGGGLKK